VAKKLAGNVHGVIASFDGHSWEKLAQDVKSLVIDAI
jgi:hypothetical protein